MDLIVYFNKKILGDIRAKLSDITNMHSINLIHFCSVILQKISKGGPQAPVDENLVTMLCQIFDCVDVDSRGFINWDDFVSFTLRSGRNSFKPVSGYVNVEYLQRMDVNAVMPVKKLYYCGETNLLYAFDGDSPMVRCIRQSGEQVGTFNPIVGIIRLIKVRQQGKQPYFAKKNTAKQDAGKLKKKKENVLKLTVTSMTWIERKRQMVFATSNSKISFWNSRLVHLIDFIETVAPQLGMLYSTGADVLLTWAGDKVNYDYSVWDCNSRTLRHQFNMHTSIILTTVEMPSLGAIVSSSMDRALLLWPISRLRNGVVRDESFDDQKLVGHTYAIRSVCFAPQNDLIIGAGFDFDIYCWDPTTSSLQMKLVGHRLSIVSVNTVNNPFERAASVDESGVVKIWNIDRAQGLRGTLLQSLLLHGAVPNHVFSFISAFDNGAVLATLSEKLLFIELTSTAMEDNRLVTGGLSVCEQNSRIVVTARKSSFEFSLLTGESGKVYNLVSDECIETCATAKMVTGVEMGIEKRVLEGGEAVSSNVDDEDVDRADRMSSQIALSLMSKGSRNIYPDDDVTCITCDYGGKKFYAGTNSGRVLMYDGTSLGLLSQLSHEDKISRQHDHNSSGAVIQLRYCERDEILVAAFAGGAVKIFCGCHRVVTEDITTALQTKTADDMKELLCPYFQGGGPPQTPLLLRMNARVHETTVMAMDVSDKLGLIAISAVDGTVRVFDYHTLLIRAIYAAPFVGSQPIEVINLQFMPLTPILIGADSNGRFTAWTVYPMKPLWIITWSLQTCFFNMYKAAAEAEAAAEEQAKEEDKTVSDSDSTTAGGGSKRPGLSRQRRSSVQSLKSMQSFNSIEDDTGEDLSNSTMVSSMQCVVWKTSSRAIKTSTSSPNRINWNIIVGEGNGMISIIDMTEVFEKMGLHDFKQLKQAYQLNSSAMVYQTVRRADITDGLEEFQVREVERSVRHPVGHNCFSNSKHGFKNITNNDVKGVIRWNAHPHAVSEIVCKQYLSTCQMHTRSQQKEFKQINEAFKTRDYESVPGSPYVVVSSSEYGVPKRWSWTGQPMNDDYGDDMLARAISMSTSKVVNLEERDSIKDKDVDGPQDLPNHPSGGASQRLTAIAEWAMPFIKARHQIVAAAYAKLMARPAHTKVLRTQHSLDSISADDLMSPAKGGGATMSDEDDEESEDMQMFSPTKNKTAGGGAKSPYGKDTGIVSIRRKANEDKRRKEHSNACWESKDRFPNLKLEIKKTECRHKDISEGEVVELLGLIEEVKELPSNADPVMKKSYSSFVQQRAEMHSNVHKTIEKTHEQPGSPERKNLDETLELDVSDNPEINDRELFMLDIRQLRTPAQGGQNTKTSPSISSPITRKESRKTLTPQRSSKAIAHSPMMSSPSMSKSGRQLLTKSDSYRVGSKEFEVVSQTPEDDDDLRELGLTIRNRERVKATRQQAISSIEATMNRFDEITNSDDKKYSYNKYNHNNSLVQRSRTLKQKTFERFANEGDHRIGSDDMPNGVTINGEGGGAGRYGPYKGRDIAAFEDFMCRLVPISKAVDYNDMNFRIGEYFPDVLSTVHMGLVYEMSEVLPIVLALNNRALTSLVKDMRVKLDGTFLREDLFDSIFIFASNCERIRIYKFAMIRAVISDVFKNLKAPAADTTADSFMIHGKFGSPVGRHQSTISPSKVRAGSRSTNMLSDSSQQFQGKSVQGKHRPPGSVKKGELMANSTSRKQLPPNRKLFKRKSEKSLLSDGKSVTTPAPTVQKSAQPTATRQLNTAALEGWSMNRSTLESLKLMFEDFFIDENGTVVGGEVVEMAQFACSLLSIDKPPNIPFLALRRSYPVAQEVGGDLIAQFFEDVLRLEIKDDMDFLVRHRRNMANTGMDMNDVTEEHVETPENDAIMKSPDHRSYSVATPGPTPGRGGRHTGNKRYSEPVARSSSGASGN